MKANIHFWLCLAQFFLEQKCFKVVEKLKTHVFRSNISPPPPKIVPFVK